MKKILIMTVCLGFMMSMLTGCGKETTVVRKDPVTVKEMQDAILSADVSLPAMRTANSDSEDAGGLFTYLSDIDYSKVEGYFVAYSSEGKADEIAVVVMRDNTDSGEMLESLKAHNRARLQAAEIDNPAEADRIREAMCYFTGRYVVMIVSDGKAMAKAALDGLIK